MPTAVLLGGLRFYKYNRHNRLLAWVVWTQGHAVSPWCRLVPGKEIKGDGRSRRSQTAGCRAQDQVAGRRASPAGRQTSASMCAACQQPDASSQMPAASTPAKMTTGMDQADPIWPWGLGSRLDSRLTYWEGGRNQHWQHGTHGWAGKTTRRVGLAFSCHVLWKSESKTTSGFDPPAASTSTEHSAVRSLHPPCVRSQARRPGKCPMLDKAWWFMRCAALRCAACLLREGSYGCSSRGAEGMQVQVQVEVEKSRYHLNEEGWPSAETHQRDRWPEKNLRSINQYTEEASTGMGTAGGHYKSSFQSRPDRCSVHPSSFLSCGMLLTLPRPPRMLPVLDHRRTPT